jgi:hypothetical protein
MRTENEDGEGVSILILRPHNKRKEGVSSFLGYRKCGWHMERRM